MNYFIFVSKYHLKRTYYVPCTLVLISVSLRFLIKTRDILLNKQMCIKIKDQTIYGEIF